MVIIKILNRIVFFLILVSIIACSFESGGKVKEGSVTKEEVTISKQEDSISNDKEIFKLLKTFYSEYIDAIENKGLIEINEIKRKYLTSELILKIKAANLDYDPIIDAQDVDINWLKSLKISKESEYFKVSYDGYSSSVNIFLEVKKDNGAYKISHIRF